ncbi:MAG: EamA family transporter, partial [Gordonibacter urolithinfaciens]
MARDYGKYVGALLLFGSNGIVASGIALPSSSVVLLRTLLGSLLLVVLLLAAKRRVTFHRHLGDLGCLAASGAALGASWLFLFEAYRHLGVGTASLVYYCGPIIVAALSPWLFGERLTRAKLAGFGLVLVGVLLVNGRALGEGASGWGLFCGGMSAVMYAAMVVFAKKVRHVEGLESSAVQLVSSFAAVALFVGATGGTSLQIGPADWAPLLVLGLVNTGFG